MAHMPPGSDAYTRYRHWIETVRPPVVKFCRQGFDPALMAWTRSTGTKIVGRWVDYQLTTSESENERIAGRVLAELLPFAAHLDYIEFANEELQGKENPREWATLMRACLAFMRKLDAANLAAHRAWPKACIANTSVGQPEPERWGMPETLETARYAAAAGHAWGHHEYYKPRPWAMVDGGRERWNGSAPAEGWLMLRVVKAAWFMKNNGINGYRFIVTESGRDGIPGQPGIGAGYKDEPITPDGSYADFMGQYGRHLSALPECVGWVDFGYHHWGEWGRFDLADDPDMLEKIWTAMQALPRGQAPTPVPVPPTVPPGLPSAPAELSACIQVRRGEGWTSVARRALGREPRQADVNLLRVANATVPGLEAGQWLISPWHKAVRA